VADTADLTKYCSCLQEVRKRIDLARRIIAAAPAINDPEIQAEILGIQLRKSLELVALATLSANRPFYESAYRGIENAWNAKEILKAVGAVHPNFYPTPIRLAGLDANGHKRFEKLSSGYLTREQFISTYDKLGGVLHAWNPHRREPRRVGSGIDFAKWFDRLERLLLLHFFHLPNDDSIYVCELRCPDGQVRVLTGTPRAA
jgi:hypothetical protein